MYLFLLFRETWVCQMGLLRANKVLCALTCLKIVHFDLPLWMVDLDSHWAVHSMRHTGEDKWTASLGESTGTSRSFCTDSLLDTSQHESAEIRGVVFPVWVYVWAFNTAYFWANGRMNFKLINTNKITTCSSLLILYYIYPFIYQSK